MPPKFRSIRRHKRKFHGNRYTKRASENAKSEEKETNEEAHGSTSSTITGFRFVDMELLSTAFSAMRCADCGEFSIVLSENHLKRQGCASSLRVFCENCGWKHEFWTSKKEDLSFEVNRRLVYSMRSTGSGHSGAKEFCTLMNMPPPPTARAYQKMQERSEILLNKSC